METALILAVVGTLCIVCFYIGAKVGQATAKGEKIPLPQNPIDSIRAHQSKKEAEYKQERLDTIMRNIEAYDGTGNGQSDVPRG